MTDITEAVGLVPPLESGQGRVLAGDDDPLCPGFVYRSFEGVITWMPHDGHPVRLGGSGLFELPDHLLGIPIRPHVFNVGAQVCCRSYCTIVNDGSKGAPWRSSGEEDELHTLAGLACSSLFLGRCLGCASGHQQRQHDEATDQPTEFLRVHGFPPLENWWDVSVRSPWERLDGVRRADTGAIRGDGMQFRL